MGDLGDVALDAPEEKEEERREEKLMLMSMEGSVHLQIQVRLVRGGHPPL